MTPRLVLRAATLLILCFSSQVACRAEGSLSRVLDGSVTEAAFRERVYHVDYEFLRHIDFGPADIRELSSREDGAAYYVGIILAELSRTDTADRMLLASCRDAPPPFADASCRELVQLRLRERRYAELIADFGDLNGEGRSPVRALIEAARATAEADVLRDIAAELTPEELGPAADELVLALTDLDRPASAELVDYVILRRPPRRVHAQLLRRAHAASLDLSPASRIVLRLKASLMSSDFTEAADAADELLQFVSPASGQVDSLVWAFSSAGRELAGARSLEDAADRALNAGSLATGSPPEGAAESAARLRLAAGRLRRIAGDYGRARSVLRRAVDSLPEARRDEARWYALSSALRGEPGAGAEAIEYHLGGSGSPAYFDDALEEYLSDRLLARDYASIVGSARPVFEFGSPRAAAQWAVSLRELRRTGLAGSQPVYQSGDVDEALSDAAAQVDSLYYRLLAGGGLPAFESDEAGGLLTELNPDRMEPAELLVRGYMSFGLRGRAYQAGRRLSKNLGTSTLLGLSAELLSHGQLVESIRIADLVAARNRRRAGPWSLRAARLRYPLAYPDEISYVVDEYALDRAVFYALIREESYFQADARSVVGATGLSQLMPATAADISRRLRIEVPNLEDPAANLSLGGWYYSWLETRVSTPMHAVAAYNGGQGRIRSWSEEWAEFSPILFAQAIPLRETRFHIRKVLVSAAYYGYLEFSTEPRQTTERYFSDFAGGED